MRERRYAPWATLAPHSWLLGVGQDSFGQALTLTTNGQDASARHSFAGALSIGLTRGDVGYDIGYEYRRLRSNVSIRLARWIAPRQSFRLDTRPVAYDEETYFGTLDASVFLGRGLSSHRLWAGWELRYSRPTSDLREQDFDPGGRPPRFPDGGVRSGLRFGWSFSNVRSSVRAVSPEQGRTLTTSFSVFHPAFGSDELQVTFRYRWTEYLLMPWRHHHVLALSLGGGISAGSTLTYPFYIGGYPEQDVVSTLINQSFFGGSYLRGYPPGVVGGSQYHLLNVEYRFPLWSPERGLSTLPLYLSHVWLAAFCDAGGAFARDLDVDELLVGVGAEVLIRVVIGYYLALTLRVGYARGLMEGGDDQVFAVLGLPF
jgi:outer membrane protein assembly factor BamA